VSVEAVRCQLAPSFETAVKLLSQLQMSHESAQL